MIKRFLFTISLIFISNICFSAVLFEDNFNSSQDWEPLEALGSYVPPDGYDSSYSESTGIPTNWSAWGNREGWNPSSTYYTPQSAGSQPTIRIENNATFDSTGKVFTVNSESMARSDQGGWSNDGWIGKIFDNDYDELYFQLKVKFPSGFKRYWGSGQSSAFKLMRIQHWDRTHPLTQYFTSGGTGPIAILDPGQNQYGQALASDSIRCTPVGYDYVNYGGVSYRIPESTATGITGITPPNSPWVSVTYSSSYPTYSGSETYYSANYNCIQQAPYITKSYFTSPSPECSEVTGYPSDVTATVTNAQGIFDGEWHTIKLHVKLNSAPGVADGVYEITYDGCLIKSLTNIKYLGLGTEAGSYGFNVMMIGGNTFNNYAGLTYSSIGNPSYSSENEQEYAIDDVIVSTTDIPSDYVIGGHTPVGIKSSGTTASLGASGTAVSIRQ